MDIVKELNSLFGNAAPLTRELISFVNETGDKTNDEPGREMMPAWHNFKLYRRLININRELVMSGNTFGIDISGDRYFYQSIKKMSASPELRAEQRLELLIDPSQSAPMQEKGQYLQRFNEALNVGNQMMNEILRDPSKPLELNEEIIRTLEKNALENLPADHQFDARDISNMSKAIVAQMRMMNANFFNIPPQLISDMLPLEPAQPLLTEAFLNAEPGSTLERNIKSGVAAALGVAVKKSPLLSSILTSSTIIGSAYIGVESIKSAVKVARNEMTATDALDNIAKNALVAASDLIIMRMYVSQVLPIPVISPILSRAIVSMFVPTIGNDFRQGLDIIKTLN